MLGLVPAALLVVIVLTDWATSRGFHTIVWIALVPGAAALLCSVRVTTVYALLAIAVFVTDDVRYEDAFEAGWPGLILVVVCAAGAVAVCRGRVRAQRHAAHIREVAETTRQTVLRPLPYRWAGLEQAAAYTAADLAARVGGDFYDIQPSVYGTRVVLGDVQGKGLEAVAAASALVGAFREAAYYEGDLRDVARRMDRRLERHRDHVRALGGDEAERFATAALVNIPADGRGAVQLVNCGHLTPLAVSRRGVRPLKGAVSLPLGMLDLAAENVRVASIELDPDETLLLMSDGVSEARDGEGVFFPVEETIRGAVATDPSLVEPGHLVRHVRDAAARHTGGPLTDDTTVLAVRRQNTD
ncbi:PP2C family protein-serine/threonine phosphatase [Streptomyces sp. NPDC056390]|uniref:PP2C family protein-serine/threonine phosphatase n=1 Tax=Streptomyces sp. NPDC056390 TaxID=3345806 RepID=UPI0035DE3E21